MQNNLLVAIYIVIILGVLWQLFRWAIKRGGRHFKLVDPQDFVIFLEEQKQLILERFVKLDGAVNFRDIGGYLTESGRRVKPGKVFRSDELGDLSDGDLSKLKEMGLQFIFDLRNRREVKKKTDRIPPGSPFKYVHAPIYENEPKGKYLPAILFNRHKLGDILAERYFFMIEKRAEAFGKILSHFADPQNFPIVYHCTAGKDRTGLITALILSILGVPEETIVADYSLSNLGFDHYFQEFVEDARHAAMGVKDIEFQGFFIVRPDWIQNILDHLKEQYGSVERYLIEKANMDPLTIDRIRTNLLA
jgi:protein-tyrosine phosphatase